ncbi:MAG: succinate-semialdehyde dehydrogenase [Candidatus Marinimicrobia bacterium]|nr:succinate-semialdehyde dehydrogenase [Candidatus Neomarinimicrobiota bacterium]
MNLKSINPATGILLDEYELYSDSKVDSIIDNVSDGFLTWKELSFDERKSVLISIAKRMKSDIDVHAKMISVEMGKPIVESRAEILKCVWVVEYYADNAEKFLERETIKSDYSESYVQYDPLGIIFGVMPWNFPYWQVFRFVAPSLMAGNVCVLKHASNVSGCALLIEKLFNDLSPYPNVFKTLLISSSQVANVISNDKVKAVTLTGSEYAGSQVAMKAGEEIKKTVLELGGSDSYIVLEDADIELASKTAIIARFLNTGQSCIAAKRFFVHQDIYDDFVDRVKNKILQLKIGDPLLDDTQIGPLAKPEFAHEIDSLVQSSIKKGAKCLLGGKKDKSYYHPTLLVDVDDSMDVFNCETFGPVFCVLKIKNIDEAIRLANNSDYGLGGSIWTSDIDKAKKIASQIETGAVFINDMTKSDPRLPFGGVKKSGYGVELSKYGIREFVNMKTIAINNYYLCD